MYEKEGASKVAHVIEDGVVFIKLFSCVGQVTTKEEELITKVFIET
jgi:hypothetical protein